MSKDYYKILGVAKNVSEGDLKKAYRKLAKMYHPDVNKNDKKAEEKFKEVNEAYEILSNPEKRKQYDLFGSAGAQGPGFDPSQWATGSQGHRWSSSGGPTGGVHFEDLSDMLRRSGASRGRGSAGTEDLGDIFGDIFGFPGGGRARRARAEAYEPQRGRDIQYSMEIDFMEAARGAQSRVSVHRGNKTEKMDVRIPAGVQNGSKIRLTGKGEVGSQGGSPGDLYIEIKVKPHRSFKREGDDLILEVPVSVGEASLGATLRIPTLTGFADLKIPPETPSGQKFRLKGKGIPNLETQVVGDMYVIPQVILPKNLDEKSRKLIEEFEKANPMDLRKDLSA